jgi:AcrR family transcriptional regulator
MGRPKTITDQELLAAARKIFREQGHAASTRDIASAAGVTQAVIFQRFQTKEELFFASMRPEPPDLAALLGEPAEAERDVPAWLRALAGRLLAYFAAGAPSMLHLLTHPAFHPRMLAEAHEHLLGAQLGQALAARFRALQKRGMISDLDPRAAAETLIAALHSAAIFHTLSGATHSPPPLGKVIEVFWNGMRPPSSQTTLRAREKSYRKKIANAKS